MKKAIKPFFFFALLGASTIGMAADATINYTGTVTQSTCSFEGGNVINIDLGTRDGSQLTQVKGTYGHPNQIYVLTGCPDAVQIQFSGVADTDLADAFKNDKENTSGGASAVAVLPWLAIEAIYGSVFSDRVADIAWVKPGHQTGWLKKDTNQKIQIKLTGNIVRTTLAKQVKGGSVQATMHVTFNYR